MTSDTLVDFSQQGTMRGPLLAFVRRHHDPSLRDIFHWFRATPSAFIEQQIQEAIDAGELTIQPKVRGRRTGLVRYCVLNETIYERALATCRRQNRSKQS